MIVKNFIATPLCLSFFIVLASILCPDLLAQIEYNATKDTVFEVSADAIGQGALFLAKPKVYIVAGGRRIEAKVLNKAADFEGGLKTVRCQWRKAAAPGTYSLFLQASSKDAPVEVTQAFNMKEPVIDGISPKFAASGTKVTVTGWFFGSKPLKAAYVDSGGKARLLRLDKPYKYPDANGVPGRSVMDLESGLSEFSFVVPANLGAPVPSGFKIYTKIGSASMPFYPDKYDLRDYGLATPVKNQNGLRADGISDVGSSVGLCWAFASLASFESSLLRQGFQTDPLADGANLSPWYLGNYISYNGHPLEFNADLWLDPVELVPPTTYGYIKLGEKGWGGGGGHWVCDYINGGNSVVLWKDCPMPNDKMTLHEDLQKPDPLPSCGYIVKDMFLFEPNDFKTAGEFRNLIKKAILDFGGVQSAVHLDAVDVEGIEMQINKKTPKDRHKTFVGHRFMDKENSNYYCYDKRFAGELTHMVCISGWDDNREIDIDGHRTTGAWLVKDSIGEMSHDKGYYWVAFDDKVTLKKAKVIGCFATAFNAHPGTGYKPPYLYQTHAGALSFIEKMGIYWYQAYESDKYSKGSDSLACVQFKALDEETLKAIGIVTINRNEDVTVTVYRDMSFPPGPEATPVYSQSFNVQEKGYHMLEFDELLAFSKDDAIIITVCYKYQKSHRHPIVYVTDEKAEMPTTSWKSSAENSWHDFPDGSAFYLQAIMSDE